MLPSLVLYGENGQPLPGEINLLKSSCGCLVLPAVGHIVTVFEQIEPYKFSEKKVRYEVIAVEWLLHEERIVVHARPAKNLRTRILERVAEKVRDQYN